nr:hypothetical protein [uncultured Moellerella sp.]
MLFHSNIKNKSKNKSRVESQINKNIKSITETILQLNKSINEIKDKNNLITEMNRSNINKHHDLYELRYEQNEKLKVDTEKLSELVKKTNIFVHDINDKKSYSAIKILEKWSSTYNDFFEFNEKQKNLDNGFFNKAIETVPIDINIERNGMLINQMNCFENKDSSMSDIPTRSNNNFNLLTTSIMTVDKF